MKLKPIINSLLENDLYKVNMQWVVLHQFNKDVCKWAFKCRNKDTKFTTDMVKEIKEQLDHKEPADGLQSETDEQRLGFSYVDLDILIRTGHGTDSLKQKVTAKFKANKFKTEIIQLPRPDARKLGLQDFVSNIA